MHATPSDRIAELVRERRRQLNLTREQIADRCAEIGAPQLTTAALTNIETGRRRASGARRREVSVEELLILAVVLGVQPVNLVVPPTAEDGEPYAVTPEVTAPAAVVRDWIGGLRFLVDPETPAELGQAVVFMPKDRAEQFSREWFTPQRQAESNRAALRYDGLLPDEGTEP
jgi:transcriptional regulator with XRE-family HTH domain